MPPDTSSLHDRLQSALGPAYSVERELGAGGMARVFLATETALGRKVVVKVLPPELSGALDADRFRREVRLAARLQHPHILPLYVAGEADGLLYYTMPFVRGETLRARLAREGALPIGDAKRLVREIAEALDHAHRHAVVHRDIKPENVLLSDGHAVVADFGIAKALQAAVASADAPTTSTTTGVAVGTPGYMAPEQALGDPAADHRVDLYALGVIAYELLTGTPPFAGRTPQRLVAAHIAEAPPAIEERRPDAPPALAELVSRLLSKDPFERPQTAAELFPTLDSALASPSAPRSGRDLRAGGVLALGALVALVLAAGSYWARAANRTGASGERSASRATPEAERSIAVFPLVVTGRDTSAEYIADGVTDALITALSRVPHLRVTPRASSYALKGMRLTSRQVGETLHVATLLEGSVQRAGDMLRIAVQLSDPARDSTLWSQSFDGSGSRIFAVQDSIARAVVQALELRLRDVKGMLSTQPTANLSAYDLYLQGRRAQRMDLPGSVPLFQRAIRLDSSFALAHVGLADSYQMLADAFWAPTRAYPLAKRAALRAVALDSSLAEAHVALGSVLLHWDWDFVGSERAFARALALNPSSATAHTYHGVGLVATARVAEGLAEITQARLLDPLSGTASMWLMIMLTYTGQYDRLIAEARRWLALNPEDPKASLLLGYGYAGRGLRREALAAFGSEPCAFGYACAWQAVAFVRLGERERAESALARLLDIGRDHYVPADAVAWVYAAMGRQDAAFEWLEKAVAARSSSLLMLKVAPEFGSLRGDPRFAALVRRVGLP